MSRDTVFGSFVWDDDKNRLNVDHHGIPLALAIQVFLDPDRVIIEDLGHSDTENRFYCIGQVGLAVLTVRFTYRGDRIRLIGAGRWRKWRKLYEKEKAKKRS